MTNNSPEITPFDFNLLRQIYSSNEIGDKIADICDKNNITQDEKQRAFVRLVRVTFLGIFPPKYFQETLEKEIDIDSGTAERIYRDLDNLIFYPHREILDRVYQGITPRDILKRVEILEKKEGVKPPTTKQEKIETEIEEPEKPVLKQNKIEPEKELEEEIEEEKAEEPKKPETKDLPQETDTYREDIE